MANWEYKVISSGKHGMATMAALEQHLNDLGQQQWEIVSWHTAPDNPLLFSGLARRPILRDWKPDEMPAAQAAARAEKAAAEETKELEAWRETLKEELAFLADKEEAESDPEADREDLLDLLRPQMKRSQRGAGSIGSLGFLARKLEQDENDLLGALAEIGLPLEEDPQAVPVAVLHDEEYFWLNKNSRGEIWLNSGPKAPAAKPAPRPLEARAERASRMQAPAAEPAAEPADEAREEIAPTHAEDAESGPEEAPAERAAVAPPPREARESRREQQQRNQQQPRQQPRQQQPQQSPPQQQREPASSPPLPEGEPLLAKLRPMMRRNRRGRGWSGSTSYLSRALRHQEAELMEAFAKLGLKLTEDPQAKPVFLELNGFLYWLNRGQGGQIWINAREQRAGEAHTTAEEDEAAERGGAPAPQPAVVPVAVWPVAPAAPAEPVAAESAAAPVAPVEPAPQDEAATAPADQPAANPVAGDNSVFARIRPHFTKNKRSASFSAAPGPLADVLGLSQADLVEALVRAGLEVPESEDAKPVFAEHAGEIFWFNRNAKDELWLNAKAKPARKAGGARSGGARSRKSAE